MGKAYSSMIPNVRKIHLWKSDHFMQFFICTHGYGVRFVFVLPNVRSGNISDSVFYGGSFGLIV